MSPRRRAALAWALTGLVVFVLLAKSFVADVYRVDSGSMRPTLFGGRDRPDAEEYAERVLVLYGRALEPERFDLVVIRSPDGTQPLVKRVCGLPGDQDLMIRDGDLFIGRARLPPDAPRPEPVVVYDDRHLEAERFFEFRRDGSVRREGGEWVVDGGAQPPGSLLHYHPALRDDYLDRRHARVTGVVEVNDAVLELEFLLEPPLAEQTLRLQLIEEGDTFEVQLAAAGDAGATLRLLRRTPRTLQETSTPGSPVPPARELTLATVPVALAAGRWVKIEFSNIDNHLRVRSDALALEVGHTYDENEPWPGPLPAGQRSLGPRVRFGIEGGRARFRSVRILRDLYYTDDGTFGTPPLPDDGERVREPAPVSLGPDDYFVLGDNSAASTDSRHFGPVEASTLIGRPLAVVWPRPRWLRAVGPP